MNIIKNELAYRDNIIVEQEMQQHTAAAVNKNKQE